MATDDEKTQPLANNSQRLYKTDINAKDIERLLMRIDILETDIQGLQLEVARQSERLTLFQGAQFVFTSIASSVAAILGMFWGK
jgi:hypothetical protein